MFKELNQNIKEDREMKNVSVLVFAPHMDDEVIGCGGALQLHKQAGAKIHIVYFTDGSYFLEDQNLVQQFIVTRKREALMVCDALGATYSFLDIPDRELKYDSALQHELVRIIQAIEPTVIYLPHENETDREHRIVYSVVREAIWLAYSTFDICSTRKISRALIILAYEVWSPIYSPDYYIDTTSTIESKRNLIKMYESQLQRIDYDVAAESLNHYRGIIGLHRNCFAEAFQVISKKNLFIKLFEEDNTNG